MTSSFSLSLSLPFSKTVLTILVSPSSESILTEHVKHTGPHTV